MGVAGRKIMAAQKMKPGALLHTEALSVGHAGAALLRDVSLDLPSGTLTAMIGVNGIGKTTVLRTLAGLIPPVAGKVVLGGRNLAEMPVAERARQIAVVLTGRPDTGLLDVETLVALGRHPWTDRWGRASEADRAEVERSLALTGTEPLRHRRVRSCSDGECQKVLIARALAQATPILLLDEPTAFLDLPNRAAVVRLLRNIAHNANKAVLFSTHDLQLALDLCDRLILLRSNGGPWQGTPGEAMGSGDLQRAFQGAGVHFDPIGGTHRFTL
jgi:iron complex transport system ATP-binding protein